MSDNPTISVLIPCFNGEEFLGEAISSVLSQIDPPSFEILVIDDGSENSTAIRSICDSFFDPRIRYLSKANGGVASALNMGLEAARGELFAWLSHDDKLTQDSLAERFDAWQAVSGPTLLFGDWKIIGDLANSRGVVRVGAMYQQEQPLTAVYKGLLNGCTVMTTIELLKDQGGFSEELQTTQDFVMWLKLEAQGVKFTHVDAVLVETRQHIAQSSRTNSLAELESQQLWKRIVQTVAERYAPDSIKEALSRLTELQSMILASTYLGNYNLNTVLDEIARQKGNLVANISVAVIFTTTDLHFFNKGTLISALQQTHPTSKIFVVSPSRLESKHELAGLSDLHEERLEVLTYSGPWSAGAARNLGISQALTEGHDYLAFLSDGNEFLPSKAAVQLAAMIERNSELSDTSYLSKETLSLGSRQRIVSRASSSLVGIARRLAFLGPTLESSTIMVSSNLMREYLSLELRGISQRLKELDAGQIMWLRLLDATRHPLHHIEQVLTIVNSSRFSRKNSAVEDRAAKLWITKEAQSLGFIQQHTLGWIIFLRQTFLNSGSMKFYVLAILQALPGARPAYTKLRNIGFVERTVRWLERR